MAYKIVGSIRSPFVRACRMFMIRNSIPFEFDAVNFVEKPEDAARLASMTPINKVPFLVDGEQTIFDSRVILGFLIKKHGLPALTLDEENRVSVMYATLDAGVALFLMRKDGVDINGPGFYFSRQRARIPGNLKYLEGWVANLNPKELADWNYPAMAAYAGFIWLRDRELIDPADYPVYLNFLKEFENAPGVQETRIKA